MFRLARTAALAITVAITVFACNKAPSEPSPNTSTTTTSAPAATNRSPAITSMVVTPAFGVSELTPFAGAASASDPDGDGVSYSWQIGATTVAGSSFIGPIRGDGGLSILLTVSDGRGGTANDSRNIVVGSMNGAWTFQLTGSCSGTLLFNITQSGGTISGTSSYPQALCGVPGGTQGRSDPAVQNTIDAFGNMVIREKAGNFSDWTFRGVMDSTGRRISGTYGPPSGSFVATK